MWTCDAPEEDGAKFGYRSESKVEFLWTWDAPKGRVAPSLAPGRRAK